MKGNIRKGAEGWHWSCTWMTWMKRMSPPWEDLSTDLSTGPGILYLWSLILPAILQGGDDYSHFILRGLAPCSDCTAQNSNSSLSNSSAPLLDLSMPFLLAGILFLTLSNRLPRHFKCSTIISFAKLLLISNTSTPLFPFLSQPRHRSLLLPLLPQDSIWYLPYNDKIHTL